MVPGTALGHGSRSTRLLVPIWLHHEAEKGEMRLFFLFLNSVQGDRAAYIQGGPWLSVHSFSECSHSHARSMVPNVLGIS